MRENKTLVWNEIFYLQQRVKFIWILDQSENSAIPLKDRASENRTIQKPDPKSVWKMTIQKPDSPVFGCSLFSE